MHYLLLPIAVIGMAACDRPNVPAPEPQPTAQQSRPRRDGCRGASLELELTPSRSEILLGEPAVVLVALRNCSNATVEVPEEIDPDYGMLQVTVTLPGGKTMPYMPLPRLRELRGRSRSMLPMEPGAVRGTVAHTYWDYAREGGAWLLDTPGIYRFTARLTSGKSVVEAPPVQIRVMDAPRGASKEQLAKIRNLLGPALRVSPPSAAGAIDESLSALTKPLRYMRSFLKVASVLVRSQQAYDRQANQFVAPQCGAIASEGPDIVRSVPDPYFSTLVASRLGQCLVQAGRSADGRKLVDLVRSRYQRFSQHPELARLLSEASVSPASSK